MPGRSLVAVGLGSEVVHVGVIYREVRDERTKQGSHLPGSHVCLRQQVLEDQS